MKNSTVLKKIREDDLLKGLLKDFYSAFDEAAKQTSPIALFGSDYGVSMGASGWISHTKDTSEQSRLITKRLLKLLGAKFGDASELEQIV